MNKKSLLLLLTALFVVCSTISGHTASLSSYPRLKTGEPSTLSSVAEAGLFWGGKKDESFGPNSGQSSSPYQSTSLKSLLLGQKREVTGDCFAGYGLDLHTFHISGRLFAEAPFSERRKLIYGSFVSLGKSFWKDVMGYMRIGVDITAFQDKLSVSGGGAAPNPQSQIGLTPGVGMRAMISKRFFLQVDYQQSFYSKRSTASQGAVAGGMGMGRGEASPFSKIPLRNQSFLIGAGVKF